MNWKPIRKFCTEAARGMGHTLGSFQVRKATPSVQMVMCETCYGCCWVAVTHKGEFKTGGRLLKYRCWTPEAAGLLCLPAADALGDAEAKANEESKD